MNGRHGKLKAIAIIAILIASGLAITPFIVQNFKSTNEGAGGAWWNGDWQYNVVLPITNANNSYQMKIIVSKNSGGNVSCGGHCKDDFGDIRFLDIDNTTQLSYWIENYTTGNQATIWINVSSDIEADQKIMMYYSNGFATTTSNGDATFIFFDDFESGNLNKWSTINNWVAQSTTVYAGSYSAYSPGLGGQNIIKDMSINYSHVLHMAARTKGAGSSTGNWAMNQATTTGSAYMMVFRGSSTPTLQYYHGSYVDWPGASTFTNEVWYILDAAITGYGTNSKVKGWKDGVYLGEIDNKDSSNSWISSFTSLCASSGSATTRPLWIDNIYVRKYNATEPVWSTTGSEQSYGARNWASPGLLYCKKITIDHTKVLENLTDFPVLINCTSTDFLLAQTSGNDIVFMNETNETKLNHEIEYFDRPTGVLTAWVNVTSLRSDIDTIIYMYYGNSTCGNQQNRVGTWNSDYVAVLHMNGSTYTTINDSTLNNNNVVSVSGSPAYQQTGKVGYSVQTTSGYLVFGSPVRSTYPMTVEVWANNIATGYYILNNGAENTPAGFVIDDDAGKYYMGASNITNGYRIGITTGAGTFPTSTWVYCGIRWDGSNASQGKFNAGGKSITYATPSTYAGMTAAANLHIGTNEYYKNYNFNGYIDEIRISKIMRSDAWMNATYDNINSTSTFESFGPQQGSPYGTSWYNADWKYCKKITIDHTKVAANLTNFPVLFSNISADFKRAQSTGNDFIFMDAINTTKYNHEIENFNSTTGELIAWINVTNLSCINDTILYLYYGNPSCSNQQNVPGTWDSGYQVICHMNDLTTSTVKDSKSNAGFSGTKVSANNPQQISGKSGYGQNFSTDYITLATGTNLNPRTNDYTYEIWAKPNTVTETKFILERWSDNNNKYYWYGFTNAGVAAFEAKVSGTWYIDTYKNVVSFGAGCWYYLAAVGDRDTSGYLYNNGTAITLDGNSMGATDVNLNVNLYMGADVFSSSNYFDGIFDEFRMSNITRSSAWINTTYNTISSPLTFMTLGNEQTNWYNTTWLYRQKITIDHNKVDADQTNFPVLVKTTMNTSRVQSTGNDIFFTSSAGVKLNHEIESYNSTSGELVSWVNVTYVNGGSSTPDTYIYLYYGNTTCSNQQNATGTWDSNYVTITHMKDKTTSTLGDSTSYAHDATKVAANRPITDVGKIGYAQHGNGTSDYATIADHADYDIASGQISTWFKLDQWNTANYYLMIYKMPGTTANTDWGLGIHAGGNMKFYLKSGGVWQIIVSDATTWTADVWYHVMVQFGAGGVKMFINNVQQASTNAVTTGIGGTDPIIYMTSSDYSLYMDGLLDETRISKIQRSSTWLSTEYKNQNDSANFTIFSTEEQYLGAGGGSNTAPNTPTALGPSTRQIAPSVTIYATATDPEGDAITMYFYNNATQAEIGHQAGASGSNISVSWSGLSQGTSYGFYARAFDSQAWSANSSVCTFTTNAPPVIAGLMTENQTDPNRITNFIPYFNWTYTDNDTDTQQKYQIQVGTTQNGSNLWDSGNVTSSTTNVKYGGTSLSRSTLYYIRIRTYDGYEWTTW